MTDPRTLAARAILESAILNELGAAYDDTRHALRETMRPGERIEADDELGTVLVTKPRPAEGVVDWPAFTRWIEAHIPDAMITVTTRKINPAIVAALVKAGEWVDPATGEILTPDGIGRTSPAPQLRVQPSDLAAEQARLILGAVPALEIEP